MREVFYPGRLANERSTLRWAADDWRRDKTTRPTDFHSLEDLKIRNYRSRIIAMLRLWIHEHAPDSYSKASAFLGTWLSELPSAKRDEALKWLDIRIDQDQDPGPADDNTVNDHWTNHARFCSIMEPYLTLCYAIKHADTGLLRHAIRGASTASAGVTEGSTTAAKDGKTTPNPNCKIHTNEYETRWMDRHVVQRGAAANEAAV